MRLRLALALVTALAILATTAIPQALAPQAAPTQAPAPTATPMPSASEADVRGAFLTTRPTTNASGGSLSNAGPAKKPAAKSVKRRSKAKVVTKDSRADATTAAKPVDNAPTGAQKIAIGYTLFMADAHGKPVRVDPAREFRTGEQVRILLEPNLDGYLYVFHSEGEGQPEMIFPDWRVDQGNNAIAAHVPYDVPAETWFTFKGSPATERVYIVVTLDPLPAVPSGKGLEPYCATNAGLMDCHWQPAPAVWASVQREMKAEVEVAVSADYGQAQTETELLAVTRGLGLEPSAPPPSVIRMSATTKAPVLVTVLDLIHK